MKIGSTHLDTYKKSYDQNS